MNKKIKQKWVKALLSGEYVQTKGKLKTSENNFCCLGVLCDLAQKEGIGAWVKVLNHEEFLVGEDSSMDTLPSKVMEWAGIESKWGFYKSAHNFTTLAHENDTGKTFKQIASDIKECF